MLPPRSKPWRLEIKRLATVDIEDKQAEASNLVVVGIGDLIKSGLENLTELAEPARIKYGLHFFLDF